jgi:hypothetical protein
MSKAILFSTLLLALVLVIAGRASAQVDRFQGEWKGNRHAHYLLKLDIAVHGDNVEVSAWSASEGPFETHCAPPTITSLGSFNDCPGVLQSMNGPVHLGPIRAEIYATHDSDDLAGKASALLLKYSDRLVILETQGDKLSATIFSQGHVKHELLKH